MTPLDPRPTPPITDPRGWALDHAQKARSATIAAREALVAPLLGADPPPSAIATALCAIAEALTSLAWTEAHPPRRFPHHVETSVRTVDLTAPDAEVTTR